MNLAQLILEGDKISSIRRLIDEGANPNQFDEYGTPLLILAVRISDDDMLSLFLEAGANVNAADTDGETALHCSASIGNLNAMKMLISKSAEIDAINIDGKTPLIIASIMGKVDACRILIDSGADINITDIQGRGVVHWASLRNDNPKLIDLLLMAGADPSIRDKSGATAESLAKLAGHMMSFNALHGRIKRVTP
jgi:ankyrin repeat protein